MIISCDQCETEFNVPESAVGIEGRAVRCSKCAHEWIAYNPNLKAPEPKAAPEPAKQETPILPTIEQKSETPEETAVVSHLMKAPPRRFVIPKVPIYARPYPYLFAKVAAFGTLLFFMLSLSIYYHHQVVERFHWLERPYQWIGFYINHEVKLELVNCTINTIQSSNDSGDMIEVEVDVSIANTTSSDQRLPTVRFSVFDVDKNFVGELVLPVNVIIPAGQNTKIEGRLNRVPKNSFFVGIDIGDTFDIYMHKPSSLFSYLNS